MQFKRSTYCVTCQIFTQTHCLSVFVFVTIGYCAQVLIVYGMGWIGGQRESTPSLSSPLFKWCFVIVVGISVVLVSSSVGKISKVGHLVATHR